jgi:hypothetical protein
MMASQTLLAVAVLMEVGLDLVQAPCRVLDPLSYLGLVSVVLMARLDK